MDQKARLLVDRLSGRINENTLDMDDTSITALIEEVRNEALVEVKAVIKELLVQAMLARIFQLMENPSVVTSPLDREDMPSNGSPAPTVDGPTVSVEQIRAEIAAIKQKITANEQRLRENGSHTPSAPYSEAPTQGAVNEAAKASEPQEALEWGFYVYCIVRSDNHPLLRTLPIAGIDLEQPVYAIRYQDLEAIVSRVSLQEFAMDMLKDRLSDQAWLETKVLAHQHVLTEVMTQCALIPMRFCTIYRSERSVQTILAEHAAHFVNALEYLENKQEWAVKIYCDPQKLSQAAESASGKARMLESASGKSRGAIYFLEKSLEEATSQEIERITDELAQHSYDRLAHYALDTVLSDLQDKEVTGRQDVMVCNAAYLIPTEALGDLRTELEAMEQEYRHLGVYCDLTGPWPPYNFVTLDFEEHSV